MSSALTCTLDSDILAIITLLTRVVRKVANIANKRKMDGHTFMIS